MVFYVFLKYIKALGLSKSFSLPSSLSKVSCLWLGSRNALVRNHGVICQNFLMQKYIIVGFANLFASQRIEKESLEVFFFSI